MRLKSQESYLIFLSKSGDTPEPQIIHSSGDTPEPRIIHSSGDTPEPPINANINIKHLKYIYTI